MILLICMAETLTNAQLAALQVGEKVFQESHDSDHERQIGMGDVYTFPNDPLPLQAMTGPIMRDDTQVGRLYNGHLEPEEGLGQTTLHRDTSQRLHDFVLLLADPKEGTVSVIGGQRRVRFAFGERDNAEITFDRQQELLLGTNPTPQEVKAGIQEMLQRFPARQGRQINVTN